MQKLWVCLCVGQIQGVGVGGRGGGWGGGGWGIWMKSLQKSIVHICSSLICLGGHPYVCHDVTHARFYQKLDLDPHIDPHIVTICGPLKLGNLPFLSIFVTSTSQIPWFHEYFRHPAPSKMTKNWYFYIFQPHHPPIFIQKLLNTNPCRSCHHQITLLLDSS